MKMNQFYKTSVLAKYGRFIGVSLVVLLVVSKWVIPEFKAESAQKQIYTLKGTHTKYNDPEFAHFIESIKQNNGYLCLGTSESTELVGGNYYYFLSRDQDLPQFSMLSGAGRTCGIYAPLFLHNKALVKGMKLIYIINPVYWRNDLSRVNKPYWKRYSNYGLLTGLGAQ